MLIARKICLAVACVLGLLISARMLAGPFAIAGVAVNAPLNLEGLFGLAVLTAILLDRTPAVTDAVSFLKQSKSKLFGLWGVVALSVIAYWPAIHVLFVSDDFILIKMARDSSFASLLHAFTSKGGDGFFRPLGYVSLAFDHLWAGTSSSLWHLSALGLHTLNSVLVVLLARRLGLSTIGSVFAGALFALHGTHPEASVWIAGRFDLLATAFTLLGLVLFTESLEERGWSWNQTAALVAMFLALLSKESAYVFPLLAVVIAARSQSREALSIRPVWIRIWPYFVVAGGMFAIRAALVGGIGGYRIAGTGEASFFSLKLGTTLKVLLVRLWTSLFFPINWSSEPPVWLGLSTIAAFGAILWIGLRAWRNAVFGTALVCLMISSLPPLHLLGGAADLSGGRLLYLPSLWFCIVLAASVEGVAEARGRAALVYTAMGCLLLFHFLSFRNNLREWTSAGEKVKAACEVASDVGGPVAIYGLPRSIQGVPAFANGFPECVELSTGRRDSVNFVESGSITADGPMLVWDKETQSLRMRSRAAVSTPPLSDPSGLNPGTAR